MVMPHSGLLGEEATVVKPILAAIISSNSPVDHLARDACADHGAVHTQVQHHQHVTVAVSIHLRIHKHNRQGQ